jgi:hypothetical protein
VDADDNPPPEVGPVFVGDCRTDVTEAMEGIELEAFEDLEGDERVVDCFTGVVGFPMGIGTGALVGVLGKGGEVFASDPDEVTFKSAGFFLSPPALGLFATAVAACDSSLITPRSIFSAGVILRAVISPLSLSPVSARLLCLDR